jgi:uncharacterized Zn-binding protein involved in type VI secretion
MPQLACNTALLRCTMGLAPAPLVILPELPVLASAEPAAVVESMVPLENIPSFGMCESLANPAVAAATAAAAGVLTPQPCEPVVTSPWLPGSMRVRIDGQPALISGSVCLCDWLGEISIGIPGQERVSIES